MTIFRENDKQTIFDEDKDGDEPPFGEYRYVTTIGNAVERLEIMGFSLIRAKQEFVDGINTELQLLQEYIDETEDAEGYRAILDEYITTRNILASNTFEDWISSLGYIIRHNLHAHEISNNEKGNLPPLVKYILYNEDSDNLFNFPIDDIRLLIRVVFESCPRDELVYQDVTGLIMSGFYNEEDAICEIAVLNLTKDYPINEKIIVLTEGSTDANILQSSLELLYPHLAGYYSFMNFGISNTAGGASSLVLTIKAFIGSGIRNRTIGLFDNDTAARDAMRGLQKLSIPENIRFFAYPELEFARSYPTLGPNGMIEADINRLACSIELYLGRDILLQDGFIQPVQWKGYNETLKEYQGEVLNKRKLQELFFQKVEQCQADPIFLSNADWEPMRQLLQNIFTAFNYSNALS